MASATKTFPSDVGADDLMFADGQQRRVREEDLCETMQRADDPPLVHEGQWADAQRRGRARALPNPEWRYGRLL